MVLLRCCQFIGLLFYISSKSYCLIHHLSWQRLLKASIRWVVSLFLMMYHCVLIISLLTDHIIDEYLSTASKSRNVNHHFNMLPWNSEFESVDPYEGCSFPFA